MKRKGYPEDVEERNRIISELWETYGALMHKIAYDMLGNWEDAEDAVANAWEKIIPCADRMGEADSAKRKGFLALVTERRAIELLRRRYRDLEHRRLVEDFERCPYCSVRDKGMARSELRLLIRQLPKKYAEPLLLHYVYGLTGEEMGRLLDISPAAAMKRLERARKLLRSELLK